MGVILMILQIPSQGINVSSQNLKSGSKFSVGKPQVRE
ncbi:hypothetical protein M595_5104 [Lyngbya aestuarii BL J]|uniref:Uncharacterized protein n=1 Tax=Lyngbya aestuarii BL J TaxID=1348334 RepID=U7QAW6_9CYAN|nr:hypothetical protein M595_5104 [Lyngbya aestuarii BL J]